MDQPVTTYDVIRWLGNNIFAVVVFLGFFIEITPVKINPVSFIFNILFKSIRKDISVIESNINSNISTLKDDLKEDIQNVKNKQEEQHKSIESLAELYDKSEISRIRWEIIEFANTVDNGQLHTRDEYRYIIDQNKRYHDLIDKYNLTNGLFDDEYSKIYNHYNKFKESSSAYF